MSEWDLEKKKAFTRSMGKKKFSKGGLVKRLGDLKYFDDGGTVLGGPQSVSNSTQTVNNNGLTGTIGNLLGLNNEFQAQGAPIQAGTNQGQLNAAYQGAQGAINQQQNFTNQVAPGGAQGLGTQAALTGQLQGVIDGTGPNAAQAALNQNTGSNIAQQAALMAGQRGASANAGLLARQAAQQGAATQQEAVGQGATLQAQQQIAAQQQLQNLAQTQVGQQAQAVQGINSAQQNEQNILQGANSAFNNAQVSQQNNINTTNAGVAAQNQQQAGNIVGMLSGGASSLLGGIGGGLGFSHGGEVPHLAAGGPLLVASSQPAQGAGAVGPWLNSAGMGSTPIASAALAPAPAMTMPHSDALEKGAKAAGSSLGKSLKGTPAKTSDDTTYSDMIAADDSAQGANMIDGGSSFSDMLASMPVLEAQGGMIQEAMKFAPIALMALQKGGNVYPGPHASHVANYLHGGQTGGKVPAMVSPGEVYLSPEKVKQVIHEGKNPLKIGEHIRGKPKVKGDSLKNDTVSKTLEEGGVVIPRHVTNKMSREKAELFVHRAMARKKMGRSS